MIQYKNYLDRLIAYCEGLSEEQFNKVAELFPNLDEVNWDDYCTFDDDIIIYILTQLVKNINYDVEVYDYFEDEKRVTIHSLYSLEELEDVKKYLNKQGWSIHNLEELEEEIEDYQESLKIEDYYGLRMDLLQKIKDLATTEQLQKFAEELC